MIALLLCLASAPLAGASRDDAIDWKSLPYFGYDQHELYLGTGDGWQGTKTVQTTALALAYVPSWARDRGLTFRAIWAPKCTKGGQTVSFSKTFYAPGEATSGGALLQYAASSASRDSIRSAVVLVNGAEIGRAGRNNGNMNQLLGATSAALPLSAAAVKAFRLGSNTLTIRVTKAALPKGVSACNTANDRTMSRQSIAVALSMWATFRADLRVGTGPSKEYVRGPADRRRTDTVAVTVSNDGPATSVLGTFAATLIAARFIELESVTVAAGTPFSTCTVKEVRRLQNYELSCPYRDFAPGGSSVVPVVIRSHVVSDAPVNYGQTYWELEWAIDTRGDPKFDNNRRSLQQIFCGPQPSDPGCAGAKD